MKNKSSGTKRRQKKEVNDLQRGRGEKRAKQTLLPGATKVKSDITSLSKERPIGQVTDPVKFWYKLRRTQLDK